MVSARVSRALIAGFAGAFWEDCVLGIHRGVPVWKPLYAAGGLLLSESVIANIFILGILEYLFGIFLNRDYVYYDYRRRHFNLHGQICFQNTMFFAVLGSCLAVCTAPNTNVLSGVGPRCKRTVNHPVKN